METCRSPQLAEAKKPGDQDDCQHDDERFLPTQSKHGVFSFQSCIDASSKEFEPV
jgi:hypothetical protein